MNMTFKKLIFSYPVNFLTFVVCLIAFKACISWANPVPAPAHVPTLTTETEIRDVLKQRIKHGKVLVVLLDFDGTLANIVPHPPDAKILSESKSALIQLSKNKRVCVGIISGRSMKDVRQMIQIPNIIYSGNHGNEIEYTTGKPFTYVMNKELQNEYDALIKDLSTKLIDSRTKVEDKKYSVTFHYRNVTEDEYEYFRKKATKIIESHGFKADDALLAVEGKSPVGWTKGSTALKILEQEFGSGWRNKVNVVYAGDDKADELAMKALKGCGTTFRVSKDPILTYSDYCVRTPRSVSMILKELVNMMA